MSNWSTFFLLSCSTKKNERLNKNKKVKWKGPSQENQIVCGKKTGSKKCLGPIFTKTKNGILMKNATPAVLAFYVDSEYIN